MVPKLVKIMRAERPDVVHTHLNVVKYAGLAAKLSGVKRCVHTVHNVAEKEAENLAREISRIYFRAGWVCPVALTPLVQDTIVNVYGLSKERIPVVYNGVDLSQCLIKEDYSAAEPVQLIHVGRFSAQKNHPRLLRSFRLLLDKVPNAHLRMLGDGELMEEVKRLAGELGILDKVEFCGSQSNVYPFLHDADLFVLPSDFEGMPMSIIEAMGTGLPVVATAVGCVPDMLRDGVCGILVSRDDQAVADACETLISDQALREKMGKAAIQDSQKFSAVYMAQEYANIYCQNG